MSARLYVIWQDSVTRNWHPVGRLMFENEEYTFLYTRGALESERFIPFGGMSDLYAKYYSKKLFPFFANRILSETRPDYTQYLSWMNLSSGDAKPLEILGRTGGGRATDSLQIYRCPEKNPHGRYESYFFCHGIRHMALIVPNYVLTLGRGSILYPMLDVLNPFDANAVALRTPEPATMVGYVPRYLARDVTQLTMLSRESLELRIEQINAEAPIQYRVLCSLTADWPNDFSACCDAAFEPIYGSVGAPKKEIVVSS